MVETKQLKTFEVNEKVRAVVAEAVRRYGIPKQVFMDNGRDYRADFKIAGREVI